MEKIDITPKTHVVCSMQNQNVTPATAVAELVDNSLDASASRVAIQWNPKTRELSISDDGVGAPNPAAIVTIGDRADHEVRASGRYGIGAKDAVLALGSVVTVQTTRHSTRTTIVADFEEVEAAGRWEARQGIEDLPPGAKSGTTVTVVVRQGKRIQPASLRKMLADEFAPALRAGRKILFDDELITPPADVSLDSVIEGSGAFQGRMYAYRVGILRDAIDCRGNRIDGGWRYEMNHRTLKTTPANRSYGTGDSDITRFYGKICLIEDKDCADEERWPIDKHKHASDVVEYLCEHIVENEPGVSDLIGKASEEHSITLESSAADDAAAEITAAFGSGIKKKREKRNSDPDEPQVGTIIPVGSGRKRRRASTVSDADGSIEAVVHGGKSFCIRFTDSEEFLRVEGNRKSNSVLFGRHHPHWTSERIKDHAFVRFAAIVALAGYAATSDSDNQPVMAFLIQGDTGEKQFRQTLSDMLERVATNVS